MHYPTLAEALRGTRGVYLSDDRGYEALGFRGFGRPGAYGNRVLITLDGVPLNDDWVWSSYVGYDLRTDLEDIDRIEVVRGPGAALYGANAFNGVLNMTTKPSRGNEGGQVRLTAGELSTVRGDARYATGFGDGWFAKLVGGFQQADDFTRSRRTSVEYSHFCGPTETAAGQS